MGEGKIKFLSAYDIGVMTADKEGTASLIIGLEKYSERKKLNLNEEKTNKKVQKRRGRTTAKGKRIQTRKYFVCRNMREKRGIKGKV